MIYLKCIYTAWFKFCVFLLDIWFSIRYLHHLMQMFAVSNEFQNIFRINSSCKMVQKQPYYAIFKPPDNKMVIWQIISLLSKPF